ncbi:MAG TPA: Maf family protein [Solirubrobacteraceae bacterium]|jgi:septum formation protein
MRRSRRRAKWTCSSPTSIRPLPAARLILASRSPQRRAILQQIGVDFEVRAADVQELESGPADEVALENAYRKAAAVAAGAPDEVVLGVDTVVAIGAAIYGKPPDRKQARETLRALGGRRHAVISGICVIAPDRTRTAAARTYVDFRELDEAAIESYLESGEWRGRAGGYAIQGRGAVLVRAIEGDYLNVVGLPVSTLIDLVPGLV